MPFVILHDTRLRGRPEAALGTVVSVDGTTPLTTGLSRAVSAANESGTELVIACHGYMSHSYNNASNIEERGGSGLHLCRESLRVSNVSTASILAGYFSRVWLMSCGPAGTIVSTSRPFCRELAFSMSMRRSSPRTTNKHITRARPMP